MNCLIAVFAIKTNLKRRKLSAQESFFYNFRWSIQMTPLKHLFKNYNAVFKIVTSQKEEFKLKQMLCRIKKNISLFFIIFYCREHEFSIL